MGLPAPSLPVHALRLSAQGAEPVDRELAEEVPVALVYGGVSFAVMMVTPVDLEDFATGFSLTEGIVESAAEIRDIRVRPDEEGVRVELAIDGSRMHRVLERVRTITGRTGCGLCGIEDLASLPRARLVGPSISAVPATSIRRALRSLAEQQVLFRRTGAVHAAAWATPDGRVALLREDVGRHNALDKLIGALAREKDGPGAGFCLVTSRCSYEMVQKATVAGFGTLVAISAPTAMAVRMARAAGITLVAFARADGMTIYTGWDRIAEAAE
jgi:FdhD protein